MPNHHDIFSRIEAGAHSGAFGNNPIPTPSQAQCEAGNYKVGRVSLHGLPIAIEQPRNSFRCGVDPSGKSWRTRLAAHYGYLSGTKGADGDAVDCFIGPWPQAEMVYVINQYVAGKFDEHKVMLGFIDEAMAKRAYLDSYDRGWDGLKSLVSMSIAQFKWWLKHGNKSRPAVKDYLPFEGHESMKMTNKVHWGTNATPLGMTLDQVLYEIRRDDAEDGLVFDSICVNDFREIADEVLALDALVTPYVAIERTMNVINTVMKRAGGSVTPLSFQVSDPYRFRGVVNVAVIWELSDGQTISILLHNPDSTPSKLAPDDELISWKWLLNKKDITIVVAPERGRDLNVREVARRVMLLADKNSAAFRRANIRRAERMDRIQALKDEIAGMESELAGLLHQIEVSTVEAESMQVQSQPAMSRFRELEKQANGTLWGIGNPDYYGVIQDEAGELPDDFMPADSNQQMAMAMGALAKEWGQAYAVQINVMKDTPFRVIKALYADGSGVGSDWSATADEAYNMVKDASAVSAVVPFDPTMAENYASVMASDDLQALHQDALNTFFNVRIDAVRSALGALGWEGRAPIDARLYKEDSEVDFTFKKFGENIIGYSVNEMVDDLTKAPEVIAAEVDAAALAETARRKEAIAQAAAEEAAKSAAQPATVTVTGNELGEFPDTEDGKKSLRAAAKDFLVAMRGEWVDCPILGKQVEIRQRGIKETIAFSADPRKLKIIPAIKTIISTAIASIPEENFKKHKKPEVFGYYRLKNSVSLAGNVIALDVIVEEDLHGAFHYDLLLDTDEVETKTALDSSSAASVSALPPDHNSGNTDTQNIGADGIEVNGAPATLDDSNGHLVFNLFIEGEAPEVIEEETTADALTMADIAEQLKAIGWEVSLDERSLVATIYFGDSGAIDVSVSWHFGEDGKAVDIDQDRLDPEAYPSAKSIARYIDEEFRYYVDDVIAETKDGAEFAGKTVEFAKSAMIVRDTTRRLGGNAHFGDFNYSMSDGLFDDAESDQGADTGIPALPYGICAQIIKDGQGIGRARIDEQGETIIYTGMSGANPVAVSGAHAAGAASYGGIVDMVESLFSSSPAPVSEASTVNDSPPVVEPQPDPVQPVDDPQKSADRALFQSVIDGTVSDISDPDLADLLEAAFMRHQDDAEMAGLFERAVDSYQAAMLAATANLA